jgi:hypothetical protein
MGLILARKAIGGDLHMADAGSGNGGVIGLKGTRSPPNWLVGGAAQATVLASAWPLRRVRHAFLTSDHSWQAYSGLYRHIVVLDISRLAKVVCRDAGGSAVTKNRPHQLRSTSHS